MKMTKKVQAEQEAKLVARIENLDSATDPAPDLRTLGFRIADIEGRLECLVEMGLPAISGEGYTARLKKAGQVARRRLQRESRTVADPEVEAVLGRMFR